MSSSPYAGRFTFRAMSQCNAWVLSIDADHVWVETDPRAIGCGNCDSPGGCRSGFFSGADTRRQYRVPNTIDAKVGEEVQLITAEGSLLKFSLLAYGLPTVLVLLGAAMGQSLQGDLWAINGAFFGLLVGLIILRYGQRRALENAAIPTTPGGKLFIICQYFCLLFV